MNLKYEVITEEKIRLCRDLCNKLMAFQKSKAHITPERFDSMNFETRMIPSVKSALHNYREIVKDDEEIAGYVYSNVSPKEACSNDFAIFFDLTSVGKRHVGCLSQFFIKMLQTIWNWISSF